MQAANVRPYYYSELWGIVQSAVITNVRGLWEKKIDGRGGMVALSVLVFMPNMGRLSFGMVESRSVMDFSVYHIDYADLYEKGIIDELKSMRPLNVK